MQLKDRYTFSELNRFLLESRNEFDPKKGDKVDSENKKNNGKAVDDIMKQSKEFDGGMSDKKTNKNKEDVVDYNKTTLDVNFAAEPDDKYKERVKAQVHGFPSAENEKNSKIEEENEGLDFEGNKDFYDKNKKKSNEINDAETEEKHAGLKSHNLPKENFKNDTLFKNENKTMKRLRFRNTKFLSEAQVLKKVPEEYKTADSTFIMEDCTNTKYFVECRIDECVKTPVLKVVNVINEEKVNDQIKRMQELFGYNSSSYNGVSTSSSRATEDKNLSEMINRCKNMENNGLSK